MKAALVAEEIEAPVTREQLVSGKRRKDIKPAGACMGAVSLSDLMLMTGLEIKENVKVTAVGKRAAKPSRGRRKK